MLTVVVVIAFLVLVGEGVMLSVRRRRLARRMMTEGADVDGTISGGDVSGGSGPSVPMPGSFSI